MTQWSTEFRNYKYHFDQRLKLATKFIENIVIQIQMELPVRLAQYLQQSLSSVFPCKHDRLAPKGENFQKNTPINV